MFPQIGGVAEAVRVRTYKLSGSISSRPGADGASIDRTREGSAGVAERWRLTPGESRAPPVGARGQGGDDREEE